MTHIFVGQLTIIGSDNGLSPGTNFSEILSESHTFSFKEMHLQMSSAKWWQICIGLNMLRGMQCPLEDYQS